MKNNKKCNICGIIAFMLFVSASVALLGDGSQASPVSNARSTTNSAQTYTDHGVLHIDGNAEFLSTAANEGWLGSGTAEDPIVIEGYRFYAILVQPVRIRNTDLHWIFRNNLVETDGSMDGFYMTQITTGIIANNTFRGCYSGVSMLICENTIIENNTFIDNTGNGVDQEAALSNAIIRYNDFLSHGADAISLEDTNDVEIYGNYINDAEFDGIDTQNGHNILIENNTIQDTRMGIRMGRRSTDIRVKGNLIRNITHYGISCNADSSLIQHNVLRDIGANGVIFSGSYELYAEDNVVTSNTFINCTDYAVQIEAGCSGNIITSNDFFDTQASCHICDNSTDAIISDNFYDTWTTPDADANGIVDAPYSLVGTAENADPTPQAAPTTSLPDDYEYIPITPTSTDGGLLPLTEIALIGGVGIIVCIIVVIVIKKR